MGVPAGGAGVAVLAGAGVEAVERGGSVPVRAGVTRDKAPPVEAGVAAPAAAPVRSVLVARSAAAAASAAAPPNAIGVKGTVRALRFGG